MTVHPSPWAPSRRAVKRGFDVVVSTVALLVLALPLLVIALLVRATSPGPSLFRQWRLGRGGVPFRIWKFRTMQLNATGRAITVEGDPRVTRLGRVLRRTKLDELPQLVNVWLGDMSFVGPRPEVPAYLSCYREEHWPVLGVRPGITDPASILLRDEEQVLARFSDPERAYRDVVLPLKLDLAREYVRRQSLLGDLALIFHTLARL
jgi:lipopolysaccharide/colanic/teichoic acid biosynthesis glycosyltransferase